MLSLSPEMHLCVWRLAHQTNVEPEVTKAVCFRFGPNSVFKGSGALGLLLKVFTVLGF